MKAKIKFIVKCILIVISTYGLCSITQESSLLTAVTLTIAMLFLNVAYMAYTDELIEKSEEDEDE